MRIMTGIGCLLLLAGCASTAEPAAPAPSPTAVAAPSPTRTCAVAELDDKQVTFPGRTGAPLGAYVLGAGNVTLVLAPQAGATGCSWLAWAKRQAAAGFRVVAFDFNGEGRSRRVETGRNSDDVAAAAAYARAGGGKVVLIGASRGGTATLVAATALDPAPDAVISLSAPAEYGGESAQAAVPGLRAPVLYVAAKSDWAFGRDAQAMYDATPAPGRRLTLVAGVQHGTELMVNTAEGTADAVKAVDDFLATAH
ncbi:alpha/beta hydrolase family protein [Dactylosporangium sp. NPDC051541]|uniref:alpha/beta hydrolase family protein n=1 Tax=Dactylosporangium sp. NPDC051541 TaxID=3363977 RepID=UPI00379825C2